MKTKKIVIAMVAAGLMTAQAAAFADTLQGVICSVDPANTSMRLSRLNPVTGIPEKVSIIFLKDVKLRGIDDLQEGVSVQIEAVKGPLVGVFGAKSIEAFPGSSGASDET